VRKRIDMPNDCDHSVFPDIVVHTRGPSGPNLLIVEAKKATSCESEAYDLAKLTAYVRTYHYVCAAFVVLPAKERAGSPTRWIAPAVDSGVPKHDG